MAGQLACSASSVTAISTPTSIVMQLYRSEYMADGTSVQVAK